MMDQVIRLQTRRQILKAAIGGAAGIVLGAPVLRLSGVQAQAVPESVGTLRLAGDLFVVRIPGEANVVAQTDANGVLLVDGGSAGASDALRRAIQDRQPLEIADIRDEPPSPVFWGPVRVR